MTDEQIITLNFIVNVVTRIFLFFFFFGPDNKLSFMNSKLHKYTWLRVNIKRSTLSMPVVDMMILWIIYNLDSYKSYGRKQTGCIRTLTLPLSHGICILPVDMVQDSHSKLCPQCGSSICSSAGLLIYYSNMLLS